jgi:hypothetical protein
MPVTHPTPWLLLVFSLPASRTSQRVEIWRKLRRIGTMPLRSAGYVLPNTAANQEKLEWLARTIRGYKGEASVVQVRAFDDLPDRKLRQLFMEASSQAYQRLVRESTKLLQHPAELTRARSTKRLRQRLQELAELDFFGSPERKHVENLLARLEGESETSLKRGSKAAKYRNRVWMTRPRPGIDRVSSAWLIRKFVDSRARFQFGDDPGVTADAIPFDMFCAEGFGHQGDDCTFETLCKEFQVRDERVRQIAQIIHDADLGDEKFGRTEGAGLDRVLIGWARQEVPDHELLRRGMELIEGLYEGLGKSQAGA